MFVLHYIVTFFVVCHIMMTFIVCHVTITFFVHHICDDISCSLYSIIFIFHHIVTSMLTMVGHPIHVIHG